ncbi:GNAT family N-acetyltransferase [Hyphomicrobium sp.]|uniref:GNAT family N-acetyltransferase n=1 Tax=Hyphomicrobium sp. TaxID=82 RepID=UPI002B60BA54|nr:GNAT family N-acetyltransferase [Hyphomicrobium sp.]HVZ04611.1 GNAT family N-acetyltransferase [Hyphomicrobium sp.]
MPSRVSIRRYLDVPPTPARDNAIDEIFFEASSTKSFESDHARIAFRDRWLGRYLRDDPQFTYLAMTGAGEVAGYLVGSLADPASSIRLAETGYLADFRDLAKHYPAHLHVNLAPPYRRLGIGGRLIDALVADARQAGASGVHVVTSAASDNVRFYNRNGFCEAGRGGPNNALVFLARKLA